MKKIILILSVFQFLIYNSYAQWVQQDSLVSYPYFNVKFINKNTGWISGHNGTIVKTTNGGINWIIQYTIPGKLMYGLHPVDSNIVYAAGWFETILKTTNGGTNWIEIKNGPYGEGHSFIALYFINENTGWISGTGNLVFKTTNAGLTFDSVVVPGRFYNIYFRNADDGLLCGQSSAMYRTTNGGIDWTEIIVPVGTKAADFYRLTFVNAETGYTQGVQNGKIYKTTNFGFTWDSLARIPDAEYLNCIFFSSPTTGWCCGDYNQIYKTTNAGYNWRKENTSQFNPWGYGAIYFVNDSIGWAVGTAGKIIHTSSGGMTFVNLSSSNLPNNFTLEQNYPNPFNNQTIIQFDVKENLQYKLEIYNLLGEKVGELLNRYLAPGNYKIDYKADNISSGIYFYILSSGKFSVSKKLILIK